MKYLFLILSLSVLLACSNASDNSLSSDNITKTETLVTNQLDKDNMVFSISQTGGCMMAGPNCAEYQLNVATGEFNLLRVQNNSVVEGKGKIEQALLDAWFDELNKMDVPVFVDSLGEGECRACYDGVDIDYNVVDNDFSVLALSSRDKAFDKSKTFFALSDSIYQQMHEQIRLEMKMRE